jgi:endonuclease III-like uncharacterized protein
MNPIYLIYNKLLSLYGSQGWWPIINNETLICEYGVGAPRNESEVFEICIGCILAQNTQWYPNVVRAIQQLKLGRPFTKEELEVVEQAEIHRGIMREKPRKITTGHKLTQNTSWIQVEKVLSALKPNLTPEFIITLYLDKLAQAIKPAGYYNQKAKKIKIFSDFFLFLKGKSPTREELLKLWGVGPETADSILLYAYKTPAFIIDTYTKRVFGHLGLIKETSAYDDLKNIFEKNLKKDLIIFQEYHALIVEHAKRYYNKIPYGINDPLIEIIHQVEI